jgi:cephalosporin hydroxylase
MMKRFEEEVAARVAANGADHELRARAREFLLPSLEARYSYNFSWMGRPIIQYPQDVLAMQEIIWSVRPDLIIETGVAHGGSLIFSASMLELNAMCGGPSDAQVVGIDIDIRPHNREALEAHPMFRRISLIQGSSVESGIVERVRAIAGDRQRVLVCLDSNHTHDHVLAELEAYAPLTSIGSYCVVFDTIVEFMPADAFPDRPWAPGNSPKTAVEQYLSKHPEFSIDDRIDNRLLISVAPGGYLRRTSR